MWLSRVVAIALGLVLMPILFGRLPKADLGVWLLLSQSGVMILLLDFGLTSTLTRRFAFIQGDLLAHGGDDSARAGSVETFERLAAAGRRLYLVIALGVGGLAWLGGLIFIATLRLDPALAQDAYVAWTIICLGQALALSNGLWTAAIAGMGHVAPVTLMATGFTCLTLLAQCAVALAGGGLTPLAVAGALGSVAFRVAAVSYLRRKEPLLSGPRERWDRTTARELMGPSLKYFLTEIGAIMLLRADPYFIAGFLDPASLPVYAANYALAFNAAVISIAIGDAGNVYVSQLWRAQTRDRVRAIVLRSMRIGMGLIALGAALLLFAGPTITALWLGEGHFVGLPIMATFCAMLVLYTQQSLMFGFSRATEHEVYAVWYLAAGVLNIALSFVLTPALGLVGVALSTFMAQAATTGWQIPLSALRRLEIAPRHYLSHVTAPIAVLFAVACAAIWLAVDGPVAPASQSGRLLAAVLAGASVGAAGCWILVLDAHLRRRALGLFMGSRRRALAPGE